MKIARQDIRKGDIILVSGWFVNSVDDFEWIPGHTPHGKALRITGWRMSDRSSGTNGYGSTTVLWERSDDIVLLARGTPKPLPNAFTLYEELRREDP